MQTSNSGFAYHKLDLDQCAFELRYLAKEHDIHFLSSVRFPNLKNVKIVRSSNMRLKEHLEWNYDELFKLSKFLLKNAMILESFLIISRRETCKSCSMSCVAQYLIRLFHKLVGCPKSSTSCAITLEDKVFRDKIASFYH
ncbi:hypothetical protein H5410_023773 [Solanum commersonii]|uniref:Uncharacterized protein n=1 Tax=Solanum commersonii TaxID=4109 RepID=A0A9J5ZJW6_SOLCO|nr:hypothetical protein H5410_023773 [Solanum commersonii]